jgi:PAS domain-containing protein
MGVFFWNFEGRIVEANEAFIRMLNCSREDLDSGRLNWRELTPPEWRDLTLRRSETYLSEAQRLSRTGSFGWDVSNSKIYWSEETYRIFEYDRPTELTLELLLQRTHPEDRGMVRKLIEGVLNERKDLDYEQRLMMPDGSVKYLRVVGHPSTKDKWGRAEFVGAVNGHH